MVSSPQSPPKRKRERLTQEVLQRRRRELATFLRDHPTASWQDVIDSGYSPHLFSLFGGRISDARQALLDTAPDEHSFTTELAELSPLMQEYQRGQYYRFLADHPGITQDDARAAGWGEAMDFFCDGEFSSQQTAAQERFPDDSQNGESNAADSPSKPRRKLITARRPIQSRRGPERKPLNQLTPSGQYERRRNYLAYLKAHERATEDDIRKAGFGKEMEFFFNGRIDTAKQHARGGLRCAPNRLSDEERGRRKDALLAYLREHPETKVSDLPQELKTYLSSAYNGRMIDARAAAGVSTQGRIRKDASGALEQDLMDLEEPDVDFFTSEQVERKAMIALEEKRAFLSYLRENPTATKVSLTGTPYLHTLQVAFDGDLNAAKQEMAEAQRDDLIEFLIQDPKATVEEVSAEGLGHVLEILYGTIGNAWRAAAYQAPLDSDQERVSADDVYNAMRGHMSEIEFIGMTRGLSISETSVLWNRLLEERKALLEYIGNHVDAEELEADGYDRRTRSPKRGVPLQYLVVFNFCYGASMGELIEDYKDHRQHEIYKKRAEGLGTPLESDTSNIADLVAKIHDF